MRVLVTGAGGQVGQALARLGAVGAAEIVGLDRATLDITDPAAVRRAVAEVRPDAVINAAAYTAVDRAEAEPDLAFAVNRDGARIVAEAAADTQIPLVHLSTDYVFDGTKGAPYLPSDPPSPRTVYGASKAAGEAAVLQRGGAAVVLRSAWIFSGYAPNFVRTILRLAAERPRLRVVADQWGHPTAAADVAGAALAAIGCVDPGEGRILHLGGCPVTTWHGFATAIVGLYGEMTALPQPPVDPILTTAYPTPAARPLRVEFDQTASLAALGRAAAPDWAPTLRTAVAEALQNAAPA